MKIVIITPILYDENSPFNHLFKDIIQTYIDNGHEIVRIVAVENYGEKAYKLGIESDKIEYVEVKRKRVKKSNIILRYLKDTLTTIKMARKLKKIKDADALFEDVGYSSYWSVKSAKKRKLKVISMLQDVWPDNAVMSGIISNGGMIYNFFEGWQKKVYKLSDKIICISEDMKAFIASKGDYENKISVIYNWGYSDELANINWEENEFVKKFNLSSDMFYVVYAGNIGRMQNVELIIRSAEKLSAYEKIKFLIIGDGVYKEEIKLNVEKEGISNVEFLPFQQARLATSIYSSASVNVIPLVEGGIKTALPSKTGVVLSCGKPAIFCFGNDCEFAKVVKDCDGVECVDSINEFYLVEKILEIYNKGIKESNGAKEMFNKLFSRTINMEKYLCVLEK